MIEALTLRRVLTLDDRAREYVSRNNSKWKRRREDASPQRRPHPPATSMALLRSYTLSVPAHAPDSARAHPTPERGVTHPDLKHDPSRLIASAASNPAVSDRALRVYAVLATTYDRGATAALIAEAVPSLTEPMAARLLGDLVSAGLLTKRLRTIGYKDGGLRTRRGFYTLAGGAQ